MEPKNPPTHIVSRIIGLLFLIALSISALAPACCAHGDAQAHLRRLPRFLTGGDISLLDWETAQGTIYKMNGVPEPPLMIFKDAGWNFARVRIWVNPSGQNTYVNDLPYTIALGKEIKDAGLVLCLDIHYSDSWADPGKQFKPAAWADLPFDQLVQKVHDYTADVISEMNKGGAMPDIVCVGNEITDGMLWPDGKLYIHGRNFDRLASLLKAADQGLKDGSKDASEPLIMIHIDRGTDWQGTKYFFDHINSLHVYYDMIGLSFYPVFHGTMEGLNENLQNSARRFKKPIVIVETSYPYEPRNPNGAAGSSSDDQLPFPTTPQGQQDYVTALLKTIMATSAGLGRGVLWWEPEWVPVPGVSNGWQSQTLFDDRGNALPALKELGMQMHQAVPVK